MDSKNKIGIIELLALSFSIFIAAFPSFGTSMILNYAKESSLISLFLGYIIGIVPLLIILYIAKHLENKNIFEVNKEKFKVLGSVINFFYIVVIIYTGFITSWAVLNFTISQLLIRTDYYVVAFVFFTILGYAVTKKIEIIARSNLILSIIGTIIFFIVVLLLIPKVEIENLFPIITETTKKNLFSTALIIPSLTITPLISILCIKKSDIENKEKYNKYIILGYILSFLVISTFIFLLLSIYGAKMAEILFYPEYFLFKKIKAFEFITRIENNAAFLIYICYFGNMCMLITFFKIYLEKALKLKKEKNINILTYVTTLIVPLLSVYIFKKYDPIILITKYPLYVSVIFIVLLLNAILLFVNKKRT